MRIAVAGFMHESNTFNAQPTDRAAFVAQSLALGPAVRAEWGEAAHEIGGFFEAAETLGFEALPILMAWATPAGAVTAEVYDEITSKIIDELKALRPDGLLLGLHGAMVCTAQADADGETVARIRDAMGPDFPIVVTLDLHGNVSARLVERCNATVAYRTCPHVDQRETGMRAARLLVRHLRGEVRLAQALCKPPLIVNIMRHDTSQPPLKGYLDTARSLEAKPGVLAVSLLPGFAYADVPQMGPTVIVVTNGDKAQAQREADALGARIWEARAQLAAKLPEAAEAVTQALKAEKRPVVMVDTGDNVGGGSAADGTIMLRELLKQGATDSVVCLYAPDEVQECAKAGVGGEVSLRVGGKADQDQGGSVVCEAESV